MATLRMKKTKGGFIWFVDFQFQGKRIRKSTKTSDKKLAELFKKDIEVRIAKDEFGFNDLKQKNVLLGDFKEKYLNYSKATKAKNTYLLDELCFRVLTRFTGNIPIRNISYKLLEDYKVGRISEVKPGTVNLEIRHLKSAFEMARKWGYLKENPFKELKQVRIKGNNLPKFLTKEQIKAVLDAVPEDNFKCLIQFYLNTGCRRNEALDLTWDQIDLKGGKICFSNTKSGIDRIVPINSSLREVLSSMEKKTEKPFRYNEDWVTHKFKKILKKSGIKNWRTLNVHSLRHTFASHLVMEGTDLYTVSKLLGHSSVAVTQIYAHLAPDYLKVSIERLKF